MFMRVLAALHLIHPLKGYAPSASRPMRIASIHNRWPLVTHPDNIPVSCRRVKPIIYKAGAVCPVTETRMDWLRNRGGDLARWLARRLVLVYYYRIFSTHRDRIPSRGPLLLVANHANSLLDAVILGRTAGRPVHFLAKAPLFNIPVFGPALQALGMLPAYRASDDPSQVGQNAVTFTSSAASLLKGEVVGIFPEGKSHDLLRIEQVKTGAARIAVQAIKEGAKSLKIVPVGINYERKERFRSAVWVNVGEPIPAEEWIESIRLDERKAMRELTNEIGERLKQLTTHLAEAEFEAYLQDLELLHPPEGNSRSPLPQLYQRKRIADAINHYFATNRERADAIAWLLRHHHEALASVGLDVTSDFLRYRGAVLLARLIWRALALVISFFVALPGTIHHLVPFLITRLAARTVQAPGRSTIALIRLLVGIPIYGWWYFIAWIVIARQISPTFAWFWTICMPVAGLLALTFWRSASRFAPVLGREIAMLGRFEQIAKLRQNQEKLRAEISQLADDYRCVSPADSTLVPANP